MEIEQDKKLEQCQTVLNVQFRSTAFLASALTHPSSHEGRNAEAHRTFERLELFGDSLLSFIITEQLLKTFPELDEGQLSKYRSTLVSRQALFNILAKPLELHRYVSVGPGEHLKSPREMAKILADVSEAIIAAVYFDQGIESVRTFVLSRYNPHLTQEQIYEISFNAKGALQEEVQRLTQRLPDYSFERRGHLFLCRVSAGPAFGTAEGEGASKKEAAQHAASSMLERINKGGNQKSVTTVTRSPRHGRDGQQGRPFRPRRSGFRKRSRNLDRQRNVRTPRTQATESKPPYPRTESKPHDPKPREKREPGTKFSPSRKPRVREPQDQVDWRSWQTSKTSSTPAIFDSGGKPKKKASWRDRIRKITGKIKKKD